MTSLNQISISTQIINKESVQTINARELHHFLESKQDFSDWIKNRIKQYSFSEGIDFIDHKIMVGNTVSKIEYHITLDMAKELSMVERNTKGKQARMYFIAMEKKAKKDLTRTELAQMVIDSEKDKARLEKENQILKLDNVQLQHENQVMEDILLKSDDSPASEVANMFGLSARALNDIMAQEGYLRKFGRRLPLLKWIKRGYFSVGYHEHETEAGRWTEHPHTKYTAKGIVLAGEVLKKRGILKTKFQLSN